MSIRQVVIRATAASAATLPLLVAGCVSTSGDMQGARVSDNFQIYAPFDNERDSGPSYLRGEPPQHLGASPADPKGPPLTGSPPTDGSTPPAASAPPPASPQSPP
jgi:hypothetical protein